MTDQTPSSGASALIFASRAAPATPASAGSDASQSTDASEAVAFDGVESHPQEFEDAPAGQVGQFDMPPILGESGEPDLAGNIVAQTWLSAAGFSRDAGSSVAAVVAKSAERYATMNEVDRQIDARMARSQLTKLWGDKTDERVALAQAFVNELEQSNPGIVDYLHATGAQNDPMVISQLWFQATRRAARGG